MAVKIRLVAVGKLKETFWAQAIAEYSKRMSRYAHFEVVETDECRNIDLEGKEILKKLKGFVVAADRNGEMLESEQFAEIFSKNMVQGISEFTFIIGGSLGLSPEVKSRADLIISFGAVTYPHQLMRVILAEQLYRAMTILNGVTYHK